MTIGFSLDFGYKSYINVLIQNSSVFTRCKQAWVSFLSYCVLECGDQVVFSRLGDVHFRGEVLASFLSLYGVLALKAFL